MINDMTIFDDLENGMDNLGKKISEKLKQSKETRQIIRESKMNTININGESFQVTGNNVIVKNNKVIVNGKTIKEGLKGIVKVEFKGDIANLDCNTAIINGNVGDIDCSTLTINGDVDGDVDCSTIRCGNVQGDVDGTNIVCGNISGDVDAVNVRRN